MQDEGYLSRPFGRTGHKTSAAEMEIWKKSQISVRNTCIAYSEVI